jgi:transposase
MSGTKGMTHYTLEQKREAVRLHLEEGISCQQVAEQLGLRQADRITAWCRAYQQEGETAWLKQSGRPRKETAAGLTLERLQMENALLKKFHTELRKITRARRNIGSSNTTERSTR